MALKIANVFDAVQQNLGACFALPIDGDTDAAVVEILAAVTPWNCGLVLSPLLTLPDRATKS